MAGARYKCFELAPDCLGNLAPEWCLKTGTLLGGRRRMARLIGRQQRFPFQLFSVVLTPLPAFHTRVPPNVGMVAGLADGYPVSKTVDIRRVGIWPDCIDRTGFPRLIGGLFATKRATSCFSVKFSSWNVRSTGVLPSLPISAMRQHKGVSAIKICAVGRHPDPAQYPAPAQWSGKLYQ